MISTIATLTTDEIVALVETNTDKVFSTMLDVEITRIAELTYQSATEDGGVIAIVAFAGDWSGSGSIGCSNRLACFLSSKLLLTDFDVVNEEVLDAMGEIANMIVGNFKDEAALKLGPVGLSTPTIIHGDRFETRSLNGQGATVVKFLCDGEMLEVKIYLSSNRTAALG